MKHGGITVVIVFVVLSLGLFVASLTRTALVVQNEAPVTGLQALLLGWMGVLCGQFPWFANPAYLVALVAMFYQKFWVVLICSLVALGLGVLSFFVPVWYPTEGRTAPVTGVGAAFYLWMSSFAVLLVGAILIRMTSGPPPLPSQP